MKSINQFLRNKKLEKKTPLDSGGLSYVFNRVIKEEYGNRGLASLKLENFKERKVFVKAANSNWANELRFNKESIANKLNLELGSDEIGDVSV